MYSQLAKSGRVHSFLRNHSTLFAAVRRLGAHGAQTFWRPSRSSNRVPGEPKCGEKGSMSTRHSFAAKTPRNGRSRLSAISIAANPQWHKGLATLKRSAIWFSCIVTTSKRSGNALDDSSRRAPRFLNTDWDAFEFQNSIASVSSNLEKRVRARAPVQSPLALTSDISRRFYRTRRPCTAWSFPPSRSRWHA